VSYRLTLGDDRKIILHDPLQFDLNFHENRNVAVGDIIGLHLQPVVIAEKRSVNVDDTLLGRLREDGCRFMNVTALRKNLSINSLLQLDHPSNQHIPEPTSHTWKGKLLGTSARIKEDFVVDDDLVTTNVADLTLQPVASYVKQRRQRAERLCGQEWTLNYQRTAGKVGQRMTQTRSVEDILTQTQEILEQPPELEFTPMQTLLELSAEELTMSEMDRISAQIARLTAMAPPSTPQIPGEMEDNDHSTRIVLRSIEGAPLPGLLSKNHPAGIFAPTYDAIVSDWITPLHNKVPGRVRLAKQQLARRLAAELTLASHILRIEDIEEHPERQQDANPTKESQSWDLPMHLASSQVQNPFASQLKSQSQSVLPTPSPTGTPSVTTASSRATTLFSAEISNLSKFTTFTKSTPSALPRSLSKLLSHWTPGTDPASYDWVATSRSISQRTREEDADSQLTEKQRARAHRKAERYIRRQRKEAEASQAQMLASSQMPELAVSASQPQMPSARKHAAASQGRQGPPPPAFGGMLSSSQHMGPGAASQAVPGRFGGRPPVKKKRKQGF
jgi:RNA polymerase I-specific transcription initiation factor RRN6